MNVLEHLKIPILEQEVPLTNRGLSHNIVSDFLRQAGYAYFLTVFKVKDKFVTAHCATVQAGGRESAYSSRHS